MKRIASILTAAIPAVVFFAASVLIWNVFLTFEDIFSPTLPWPLLCDFVSIALCWSALPRRWVRKQLFSSEPPSALILGAAVTGVLACASLAILLAAMSGSGIALIDQALSSQGITTTRVALWALAHAAIVEELTLRGILQPAIEEARGVVVALIATTLAFVLMHAGNGNFAMQWPFYALLAAVNGYLAWRSKSVALPIAVHAVVNLGMNGAFALHGPIPGSVLRSYTIQLSVATLLAGALFAMCVVLDRLRTRGS